LEASFTPSSGVNEWWVEVYVDSPNELTRVQARVDDGSWRTLSYTDWGSWAASFHVPEGSEVQFRVTDEHTQRLLSRTYTWLQDGPPRQDQDPLETSFTLGSNVNEWWVESYVTGSNPYSTQDDVCAALAETGVEVYAWHGVTREEYADNLDAVLAHDPVVLVDDGADLVAHLHERRADLLDRVLGAAEETTTGVVRMEALEREGGLRIPVVAVNDARTKHLFDNRYGTGQSVWDGVMRTTNLTIAGRTVVVVGYGWCGKGIAARARGLGARVVVTEIDPMAANEALMEGFEVMPIARAAEVGDIFVTATGVANVLRGEHFERMRDGALLSNAGHFDVEISLPDLANLATTREDTRPNVATYVLPDGRRLHLLAEGALVNLAGGDGHPAEIMDMSFALQALAVAAFARGEMPREPGVYRLPREIDERVAALRLEALGVAIDELTPEQDAYRDSWRVG
jgi:adenosylhomocysteinase